MLEQPVDLEIEKWNGSYPKGWSTIVEKCIKLVALYEHSTIRITQIKEKFGSLRFYYDIVDPIKEKEVLEHNLRDRIFSLEEICSHTCQECGTTLEVSTGPIDPEKRYGWIHTLCNRCRKFKLTEKP